MPLVRVSAFGLSSEVKKSIAQEMHDVVMRNTKAPSEAVWVMFEDVPRENWMIHETMLSEAIRRMFSSEQTPEPFPWAVKIHAG